MDERLCVRRCLFDMMRSESLKEFPRFEYVFEISTTMRKMREGIKEEEVYILVHMGGGIQLCIVLWLYGI